MLATLGTIVTVLGMLLALVATRVPAYREPLEQWGGGCFLAGLVLLAFVSYSFT